MSLCSLSYLGDVLDRASAISCGSDATTDPVTGWIITIQVQVKIVVGSAKTLQGLVSDIP